MRDLSAEEIAAIEARAAKATPGPWETNDDPDLNLNGGHDTPIWCPMDWHGARVCVVDDADSKLRQGNADFIAHARTVVPVLAKMAAKYLRAQALLCRFQGSHVRAGDITTRCLCATCEASALLTESDT